MSVAARESAKRGEQCQDRRRGSMNSRSFEDERTTGRWEENGSSSGWQNGVGLSGERRIDRVDGSYRGEAMSVHDSDGGN